MRAFSEDSRTEKREDGLFFYEQDILYSAYLLSGDVTVDLYARFEMPGLGFVLAEDNELGFRQAVHRYLFDIGSYEFNVYEKHNMAQNTAETNSCTVTPAENEKIHLRFQMKKKNVKVYHISENDAGKEVQELIGSHKLTRKFDTYRMGIYSNAGNTVSDVAFQQNAPDNWEVSTKNIRGGLVTFFQDGFKFEKCMQDAEIEQDKIHLKQGVYYLRFDRHDIDGVCDIQAYLFPYRASRGKDGRISDYSMEDPKKNMIDKHGVIHINDEGDYDLKFKGTSGKITRIAIMDKEKSDYVQTHESEAKTDGSNIEVSLNDLEKVEWDGVILDVPEYLDLRKPCPYAILLTDDMNVNLGNFLVEKGKQYHYVYDCDIHTLRAYKEDGVEQAAIFVIFDSKGPKDKITIFKNVSGTAYNLTLTYKGNRNPVNVNLQKTYRAYVPSTITGPILVTDPDGESYNLSASHREIVEPKWRIDYFGKNQKEMRLKHNTVSFMAKVELYGIPKDAKIHKDETEIQDFCKEAIPISMANGDLVGNKIIMMDSIRNQFSYIAVHYASSEDYTYLFTNYEREIFDAANYVVLDSLPAQNDESLFVYGIPEDGEVYDDYVYRIPNESMINSIDLYASKYDIIPSNLYTVISSTGEVQFDKSLENKYKSYVIDYLKRNAYAINYDDKNGQYAVDISSEDPSVILHYEMDSDGGSDDQIRTTMKSDKNKFIVLRRKQGEVFDN